MTSKQGQDRPTICEFHVQPRAKRTTVVGWHGESIKIRLAAPPVNGAANEELVKFLAHELGLARSSVSIVGGKTARRKRVALVGVTREEVLDRLRLPLHLAD